MKELNNLFLPKVSLYSTRSIVGFIATDFRFQSCHREMVRSTYAQGTRSHPDIVISFWLDIMRYRLVIIVEGCHRMDIGVIVMLVKDDC